MSSRMRERERDSWREGWTEIHRDCGWARQKREAMD